jgi:hypothetical protein
VTERRNGPTRRLVLATAALLSLPARPLWAGRPPAPIDHAALRAAAVFAMSL